MEYYYSALKMKEILTHAVTWINFEHIYIKWNKTVKKDNYYMIPLR